MSEGSYDDDVQIEKEDVSVATNEVLSENDREYLNNSDQEMENSSQMHLKPNTLKSSAHGQTNIKSSTLNNKNIDKLEHIRAEENNNQQISDFSKTSKNKEKKDTAINYLKEEIFSLKSMIQQKDNLLEKMSYVFKEKDIMISKLQHKASDTVYAQTHFKNNKSFSK